MRVLVDFVVAAVVVAFGYVVCLCLRWTLSKMKRWNVRSSCSGSLGVDVGCEATGRIMVLPFCEMFPF